MYLRGRMYRDTVTGMELIATNMYLENSGRVYLYSNSAQYDGLRVYTDSAEEVFPFAVGDEVRHLPALSQPRRVESTDGTFLHLDNGVSTIAERVVHPTDFWVGDYFRVGHSPTDNFNPQGRMNHTCGKVLRCTAGYNGGASALTHTGTWHYNLGDIDPRLEPDHALSQDCDRYWDSRYTSTSSRYTSTSSRFESVYMDSPYSPPPDAEEEEHDSCTEEGVLTVGFEVEGWAPDRRSLSYELPTDDVKSDSSIAVPDRDDDVDFDQWCQDNWEGCDCYNECDCDDECYCDDDCGCFDHWKRYEAGDTYNYDDVEIASRVMVYGEHEAIVDTIMDAAHKHSFDTEPYNTCGIHVHVNYAKGQYRSLTNKRLRMIAMAWLHGVEQRFIERWEPEECREEYCQLWGDVYCVEDVIDHLMEKNTDRLPRERYLTLNMSRTRTDTRKLSDSQTIEFRLFNATTDRSQIKNMIADCAEFVKAVVEYQGTEEEFYKGVMSGEIRL